MYDESTSAPIPSPLRRHSPLPAFYFLEDLKGKVFWEAMDPYCCKFLHQVLNRRKPEDIQMIFSEVKDQICMLMLDKFGSFVIEKLYEVCNEEQMDQFFFFSVTADVDLLMVVCLNSQGFVSMKKFLDCLTTPEQKSHLISIFQQRTLQLVNDRNGSHVIRHCFDIFLAKETQPIYDVISGNFFQIATNESGWRLLLHVLESKDLLLESRPRILSEIIANVHCLSHDPFGHNVVEDVIEFRIEDVVRDIVAHLTGYFACLSMNKCATNVVLTLMKYKEEYAPQIINEIISSPDFSRVLLDPYGKFVLKYAEKYTTETVRKILNQDPLYSDHLHSHRIGKNLL